MSEKYQINLQLVSTPHTPDNTEQSYKSRQAVVERSITQYKNVNPSVGEERYNNVSKRLQCLMRPDKITRVYNISSIWVAKEKWHYTLVS